MRQLSTTYSRGAIIAAGFVMQEWPYLGGSGTWNKASLREWFCHHLVAGSQKVREEAVAYLGEWFESAIDTPIEDFDVADLRDRLKAGTRWANDEIRRQDRERIDAQIARSA